MGAAISLFDGATAVVVPRSRFLPVKKTDDLILIRSDCYQIDEDFSVREVRSASDGTCVVDLDAEFYDTIQKFDARFARGAPSLLKCTSFSIRGDVAFGKDIRCVGDVRIENPSPAQATIADNTSLEKDVTV